MPMQGRMYRRSGETRGRQSGLGGRAWLMDSKGGPARTPDALAAVPRSNLSARPVGPKEGWAGINTEPEIQVLRYILALTLEWDMMGRRVQRSILKEGKSMAIRFS